MLDPLKEARRKALTALAAVLMSFALVGLPGCVVDATDHGGASAASSEESYKSTVEFDQIPGEGEWLSPEEQLERDIADKVSSMSLHEKVSQMVITRPEDITGSDLSFTAEGAENLLSYPFGGVCYFSKNLSAPDALRSDIVAFQDAASKTPSGIGMFVTVDEEGGGKAYPGTNGKGVSKGIARLASEGFPGTSALYPMFYYKDAGEQVSFDNAATIASYLSDYGFNWDFAPVADTNSNPSNPIIGVRAYSDDYHQAAELVSAAVEGFESEDMACALKHFPGHGDTKTDTHKGSAVIADKDYYALLNQELVPFKAGIEAGADAIMMGHITVVAVDDAPASMSREWIEDVIRGELGFAGVVITDGLGMGALTNEWTGDEIAVACVKAGNDILLLPEDPYSAVDAVVGAVESEEVDEAAIDGHVSRILAMKARHGIWSPDEATE